MKLYQVFCVLCTFVSVVAAGNDGNDLDAAIDKVQQDRDLQISNEACNYVSSTIFNGRFICDCQIQVFAGTIDLQCKTNSICSPGNFLCGTVGVDIGFALFGGDLPSVNFCVFNATFGPNINLFDEPFCILPGLSSSVSSNQACTDGLASCIASGQAGSITKPTASMESCDVRIGPKKCTSCTTCGKRGGVTFDCSNIVPGLKSTTCAKFKIPTGLGSKARPTLPDVILAH